MEFLKTFQRLTAGTAAIAVVCTASYCMADLVSGPQPEETVAPSPLRKQLAIQVMESKMGNGFAIAAEWVVGP